MLKKGDFIAKIPNDDKARDKIKEYKTAYGQLRLRGRHPNRKQVMAQHGLTQNYMGDIPYRLGTEIAIYRNENGITFRQFQDLRVGDMIETAHPRSLSESYRYPKIGIVLDKKGKNKVKIALGDNAIWTTRQRILLYEYDKK